MSQKRETKGAAWLHIPEDWPDLGGPAALRQRDRRWLLSWGEGSMVDLKEDSVCGQKAGQTGSESVWYGCWPGLLSMEGGNQGRSRSLLSLVAP